jgi:hypothetical protein
MVCRSRHRRLLHSCDVLDGSTDFVRYLAHHSLGMRSQHSRAHFDMS